MSFIKTSLLITTVHLVSKFLSLWLQSLFIVAHIYTFFHTSTYRCILWCSVTYEQLLKTMQQKILTKISFSVLNYVIRICLKLQTDTFLYFTIFWSYSSYPSVKDFELLRILRNLNSVVDKSVSNKYNVISILNFISKTYERYELCTRTYLNLPLIIASEGLAAVLTLQPLGMWFCGEIWTSEGSILPCMLVSIYWLWAGITFQNTIMSSSFLS